MRDSELIICAAARCNGNVYRGHRHQDAVHAAATHEKCDGKFTADLGFLTSDLRFVDRREALEIAFYGGQLDGNKEWIFDNEELESTDLY